MPISRERIAELNSRAPRKLPDEEREKFEEQIAELEVVRSSYKQIRDFSLVLASQAIPHRLRRELEGPYSIHVEAEFLQEARRQIELYNQENPPREENPPLPLTLSLAPLLVLAFPAGVTLLDFSEKIPGGLHRRCLADAEKILNGEFYRTVTALFLHGDSRHIMSNLLSGYVILNLLAFRLPLSRMVLPLLVASALANYAVAFTVKEDFRSLGFSTFVFASLGALSVIEFRLVPHFAHGLFRRFAPLFAAILLALFLGLGENSDILAHGYGFLFGLVCGVLPRKKTLLWGDALSLKDLAYSLISLAIVAYAFSKAF